MTIEEIEKRAKSFVTRELCDKCESCVMANKELKCSQYIVAVQAYYNGVKDTESEYCIGPWHKVSEKDLPEPMRNICVRFTDGHYAYTYRTNHFIGESPSIKAYRWAYVDDLENRLKSKIN